MTTLSAALDEQKIPTLYNEVEERLRKFGLELAQDKTRVMPFSHSSFAAEASIHEEPGAGNRNALRDLLLRPTTEMRSFLQH